MQEILIILISVIGGGFGVELVKNLFGLKSKRLDDAAAIRQELREALEKMEQRVEKLQLEVKEWQDKYYTLLDRYIAEKEEWKRKYFELQEIRNSEKDEYQETLNNVQEKYNKANSELEAYKKLNVSVVPTTTT